MTPRSGLITFPLRFFDLISRQDPVPAATTAAIAAAANAAAHAVFR